LIKQDDRTKSEMREQAGPTANVDWGPSFEVIGASLEAAA